LTYDVRRSLISRARLSISGCFIDETSGPSVRKFIVGRTSEERKENCLSLFETIPKSSFVKNIGSHGHAKSGAFEVTI
jgi:hypothetical protein